MSEIEGRAAVVREALTWQRTPYQNGQRVKQAGVDCLMIIVAVYEAVGLITDFKVPAYRP